MSILNIYCWDGKDRNGTKGRAFDRQRQCRMHLLDLGAAEQQFRLRCRQTGPTGAARRAAPSTSDAAADAPRLALGQARSGSDGSRRGFFGRRSEGRISGDRNGATDRSLNSQRAAVRESGLFNLAVPFGAAHDEPIHVTFHSPSWQQQSLKFDVAAITFRSLPSELQLMHARRTKVSIQSTQRLRLKEP